MFACFIWNLELKNLSLFDFFQAPELAKKWIKGISCVCNPSENAWTDYGKTRQSEYGLLGILAVCNDFKGKFLDK